MNADILDRLAAALEARKQADPQTSYVARLYAKGLDAVEWARKMEELGAGEILLTSMDRDGAKIGFDLNLTRAIVDAVNIPVIASGGVGNLQHLADGVKIGGADAVLAASIFHFGEYTVEQCKRFMAERDIEVRL